MNTNAQTFLDYLTTAATHLARVARVHLYALSTSVFSFVLSEAYKLTPRRVCDGFGETLNFPSRLNPQTILELLVVGCKKVRKHLSDSG